jgi:hypothetical protein
MDPDPALFVIDLQDANRKLFKKKNLFLFLFEGTFTSFQKEVTKAVGIKVFLTIFAW